MPDNTLKARYVELLSLLKLYSNKYYNENISLVTDAEYDRLYNEFLQIERDYPELRTADSISVSVGAKVSTKAKKINHLFPMFSLQNAYNELDLSEYYQRVIKLVEGSIEKNIGSNIEMYAEPKIDGLSCSLRYEKGILVKGISRGDGSVGEDVTENVKTIKNIPHRILSNNVPDLMEIRGEVYLEKQDFEKLNLERQRNGEDEFSNARNAASGSLRQLDSKVTANRNLKFFAYALECHKKFLKTQQEISEQLKSWGFVTNVLNKLTMSIEELLNYYNELNNIRATLDYDIDGAVYKVNSLEWQVLLGESAKYPRYAIAHKFSAEEAITYVKDIIFGIGRTGVITPVAILSPINIGGVEVSRATLHNKNEILRKDIRVGDKVLLRRAGDVIPQIIRSYPEYRSLTSIPFEFPSKCPFCGAKLESGQTFIRCTEVNSCKAQILDRLVHFCSRDAMNIDGLAERNMEFFFDHNLIKTPSDIFTLKDRLKISEIVNCDGWGELSIKKIFEAIENARSVSLDRFIYALGIGQIGKGTAKLLARKFGSLNAIRKIASDKFAKLALTCIDGIGSIAAHEIINYFNNSENIKLLDELQNMLQIEEINNSSLKAGFFADKTFVLTGTLKKFNRKEAEKQIESKGGKILNSVSKNLDFLLVGEAPGSKYQKAKKLGINILYEEEFEKLLNE